MLRRLSLAISVLTWIHGECCPGAQTGEPEWFFRSWQTEEGLPENSVSGIVQSPDGFLWIGTNAGASRFNGTEFEPLQLRKIPNLPSRQVHSMFIDRSERLWLALERGSVIRLGKDSFRVFTPEDGVPRRIATDIAEDRKGRLWIAYPRGLCRIEGDTVFQYTEQNGIPYGPRASIACDADGQIWFANGGKIGRVSDEGFDLLRDFGNTEVSVTEARKSGLWLTVGSEVMALTKDQQFTHIANLPDASAVTAIHEDRQQALWICTHSEGLFRLHGNTISRIPTSYPRVNCVTEDHEGNIWVGTPGGGLNLVMPRIVKLHGDESGLPFTVIQSIAYDSSGSLWAVSQAGKVARKESGPWRYFDEAKGAGWASCVAADSEGGTWIGTRSEGLLRVKGDIRESYGMGHGLAANHVRSVLVARNGDVWIATDGPFKLHRMRGGVISQIPYDGPVEAIRALAEASDGSLWFGTSDGHLFHVDDTDSATKFPLEDISSIRTLYATDDGSLWIGFAGEGLGHIKDGQYTRITTSDGLFNDYISQILHDEKGSLWITSNRGLFQVDPAGFLATPPSKRTQLRCRFFGRSDGLPSFRPSRDFVPSSCRSPDGRLTFATGNGLLEVRTDDFYIDSVPPPVVIERVTVDGNVKALHLARSMQPHDSEGTLIDTSKPNPKIVLPPGPDRMVISFSALSLASPENRAYRYRLSPLDKTWQDPQTGQSATFTSLSAGEYRLQVIACNSAGVWNKDGATLVIVIEPFFWETWWFKLGGGAATALAAGGFVFFALRRKHRAQLREIATKRALEQERSRIARDIHDDLGASLTRISLLSQASPNPHDQPAKTVLGQIQETARHLMRSMDGVVWAIDPLHDTFDDLANYLSTHAQDFLSVAGVSCRLNMPVDLPELPLTAQIRHNLFLAFKEALNNVVKYAGATEVRISLLPGEGFFTLTVQDNGKGIDPSSPPVPGRPNAGSGLANMENRMKLIGGTCSVQSSPDKGTTVEFQVPLGNVCLKSPGVTQTSDFPKA
jgi:signal transduction histidine kinase/ligand-binding sensor domain-containing protein